MMLHGCSERFESVFSFHVFLSAVALLRAHKIQKRCSCPFMSGQVLLLRGDLASQRPSPFQSCRARLYLQIRGCLARSLYCLDFYLKEKPDLAPAALSVSVSLSVHPSVTVTTLVFSSPLHICHFCPALFPLLSLSHACHPFPRPTPLCYLCECVFLHTLTHRPYFSSVNPALLFRCEKCVKRKTGMCRLKTVAFTLAAP